MIKLITSEPNVRYLSGFTGSVGILIINGSKSTLIVDGRYGDQAKSEVKKNVKVIQAPVSDPIMKVAIGILQRSKAKEIGFEDDKVNVEAFNKLSKALPETKFISISAEIRDKRMIKHHHEVDLIAKAALIADLTFDCAARMVRAGMTEKDLSAQVDYLMKTFKGDNPSFETLVSAGKMTAYPHHKPGDKVVENGDCVLFDLGVRYKGYCSDMTRMLCVGKPSEKQSDIYKAVLEAHNAAIAKVKHGVKASAVDAAARNVLKKHKLDKYFNHATGHGIGLQVHEGPRVSPQSNDILKEGMITSIEPGVYIEGYGGFRLEDMVLVTKKGCVVLTKSPRELMIV
jgi:Xaa-Pro aminopeptidase